MWNLLLIDKFANVKNMAMATVAILNNPAFYGMIGFCYIVGKEIFLLTQVLLKELTKPTEKIYAKMFVNMKPTIETL